MAHAGGGKGEAGEDGRGRRGGPRGTCGRPHARGRPRFLVDAMCHPLVSWLRIFDYDTLGALDLGPSPDDDQILRRAREDGRVLVTRDQALARQARALGVDALLVEGNETEGHLRQMVSRLALDPTPRATRCTACNGPLERVSGSGITDEIASSVAREGGDVWRCRRCGQHYWQGTHWANIERTARNVARTRGEGGDDDGPGGARASFGERGAG